MNKLDKIITALLVLFVIGLLCFGAYVLLTYGGKPITEIPSWAVWFFIRK